MNIPRVGDIGHVAHFEWWNYVSKVIRYALNHWHRDWCKKHHKPYREVRGTHDFLFVECKESKYGIGAGESLAARGTVITPWEKYLEKVADKKCEVWVFDAGFSDNERKIVNDVWMKECKSKPYDWLGILNFLNKIMAEDFSDRVKEWKFAVYCTESVAIATRPVKDIFQCRFPTPMHTEQVAYWLSRKPEIDKTLTEKFHYS